MTSLDSFKSRKTLKVGGKTYVYYSLPAAEKNGLKGISKLPYSMKVLLENLLRNEDGRSVKKADIEAMAKWARKRKLEHEIAFRPARVLMQDFTGVPAVVDLAARMSQVQVQSNANHAKVRSFFIKYQDRLMYGTDLTDSPPDPKARAQNPPTTGNFTKEADDAWRSDWRYLATPLSQHIAAIKAEAPGLALPRAVIDKIYYANARRFFHLKG